jgi:hypothetical protein
MGLSSRVRLAVLTLLSGLTLGSAALADEGQAARSCALRLADPRKDELQSAYRSAQDFSAFASLAPGKDLDEVFDSADALFAAIQTGRCQAVVTDGATAAVLASALAREGLAHDVFAVRSPDQVIDGLWARAGYPSRAAFVFSRSVSPSLDPGEVKALAGLGVADAGAYRDALKRMDAAGYAPVRSTAWLLDFLQDEKTGAASGRTALAVRQQRVAAERARSEAARRAELAEFPYVAFISCGMNGANIAAPACFTDTDLEIRNGSAYGLYRIGNLGEAGPETNRGLMIKLRRSFSIRAQNSDDTLVLGVEVQDAATRQVLFQQQASQYRTIRFSR